MPAENNKAILLMGATATGKTDLAVELVQRYPMEIVSVDSALIYRDMDIGTAKPPADLLERAPHHLIDILDPSQSWSVWEFVQRTVALISNIRARGRIPLLVGGTMMYFNALQQGMHDLPVGDDAVRHALQSQLREQGLVALYQELRQCDPDSAQRLKPTDTQRILRALEVYLISGSPMSELLKKSPRKTDIAFTPVILDVDDRGILHRRIARRFSLMLEQGFQLEVEALKARGDLNLDMPSMRCVGYRQMWNYLEGNFDHQEMVDKSVAATRQLAKRQLTWLRKYPRAHRYDFMRVSVDEVCRELGLDNTLY